MPTIYKQNGLMFVITEYRQINLLSNTMIRKISTIKKSLNFIPHCYLYCGSNNIRTNFVLNHTCKYHRNFLSVDTRNRDSLQHIFGCLILKRDYLCCLSYNSNWHDVRMKGKTTKGIKVTKDNIQCKHTKSDDFLSLFKPVKVEPYIDPYNENSIGEELAGLLKKDDLKRLLNKFYRNETIIKLSEEKGLQKKMYHQSYVNFRRYCVESKNLPTELHVIFADILQGTPTSNITDIFPFFLEHARQVFPHLECMDDLKYISDLRLPANWYPEARSINRKVIFHAGPTNSGKTYHALNRLISASSGLYCGPLRMLAAEVYKKTNQAGTACDLVTGEDRRYAVSEDCPAAHTACTVEMTNLNKHYQVAVIDEIQMIRDLQRGWAWTRALLGTCAEEIHLCGETAAIEVVREMVEQIGEEFEVRKYKRLTPLKISNKALESFDNIQAGDCIVCFSKNDIYYCSRQLEQRNIKIAVIYGSMPSGAKLAQSEKFNDPNDPCKVLVATDAIGMGLNLNIKRVVFYSLMKLFINDQGEKEVDVIPVSQAKQIGGRAGRFNTDYAKEGTITTFNSDDIELVKELINAPVDDITKAGLHPTADQIELFAYHLPDATLSNLIDIFINLCQLDNNIYFMCNMDDFKYLADLVEHVPLELRARYVFCCSPIDKQKPYICSMFLKFARRYSKGEQVRATWLHRQIKWPPKIPNIMSDLVYLESVFDVLDLYLWLGFRFPETFIDMKEVKDMQLELDAVIQQGINNLISLLRNTDEDTSDDHRKSNKIKKIFNQRNYITKHHE